MPYFRTVLIHFISAALLTGTLGAQISPSPVASDENFSSPDVSGSFVPMRIATQNVDWSGNSPVPIPFITNQRGTFWVAIYELGSTETGERGPNGAWLRLAPQDKFVAVTARQTAESGQNVIRWDGTDFEGNTVTSGNYAFDLFGVNDQDKPALAGPGPRNFTKVIIDTRFDPPESGPIPAIAKTSFGRNLRRYRSGDPGHGLHRQPARLRTMELCRHIRIRWVPDDRWYARRR